MKSCLIQTISSLTQMSHWAKSTSILEVRDHAIGTRLIYNEVM